MATLVAGNIRLALALDHCKMGASLRQKGSSSQAGHQSSGAWMIFGSDIATWFACAPYAWPLNAASSVWQ